MALHVLNNEGFICAVLNFEVKNGSVHIYYNSDDTLYKKLNTYIGLDDSDNESTVSSTLGTHGPEAVREYDCVETTRVYTPILQPYKESKGECKVLSMWSDNL